MAKAFFGVWGFEASKKRKKKKGKEDVTPRVATQQPSSGCDPVTARLIVLTPIVHGF